MLPEFVFSDPLKRSIHQMQRSTSDLLQKSLRVRQYCVEDAFLLVKLKKILSRGTHRRIASFALIEIDISARKHSLEGSLSRKYEPMVRRFLKRTVQLFEGNIFLAIAQYFSLLLVICNLCKERQFTKDYVQQLDRETL